MVYPKVIEYCNKHKISISAFEKKCGLTNGTVNGWRARGGEPSLTTVKKISEATKIPVQKWLS